MRSRSFVFFYLMKPQPEGIRETVPLHVEYWKSLNLAGYSGGPFADRSGGLIVFDATSLEEATRMVDGDPFAGRGLLQSHWIKEWQRQQ
jgi:uncharacterized protein YciI